MNKSYINKVAAKEAAKNINDSLFEAPMVLGLFSVVQNTKNSTSFKC